MAAAPGVVTYNRINPLSVMQLLMQYQGQKRAAKARQDAAQWEETKKVLDYGDKFRPELTIDPDLNNALVKNTEVRLRQGVRNHLTERPGDTSGALAYSAREIDNIRVLKTEYENWIKTDLDIKGRVEKGINNGRYSDQMKDAQRKITRNPDGTVKLYPNADGTVNDMELRQSMANAHKIFDDPNNYSQAGVFRATVNDLPELVKSYREKLDTFPGRTPDQNEDEIKAGLQYMKNPKGGLMYDENMNPIPIVNDFTLRIIKQDEDARFMIDTYGGPTEESQIEYLKKWITPGVEATTVKSQLIKGNNIPDGSDSGSTKQTLDIQLQDSPASNFKPIEEVGTDRANGFRGKSIDLQNVFTGAQRQGRFYDKQGKQITGEILGFNIDPRTGDKGVEVVPYDNAGYPMDGSVIVPLDRNLTTMTNLKMSPQDRQVFNDRLDEFKKAPVSKSFIDDKKLDNVANRIVESAPKQTSFLGFGSSDKTGEQFAQEVVDILRSEGITKIGKVVNGVTNYEDIDVKAGLESDLGSQTDFISINGEEFKIKNGGEVVPEEVQRMKDFIYDQAKAQFSKTSEQAQGASKTTPEEFNAKWATLKPGDTLVGPDGKTYTKK